MIGERYNADDVFTSRTPTGSSTESPMKFGSMTSQKLSRIKKFKAS